MDLYSLYLILDQILNDDDSKNDENHVMDYRVVFKNGELENEVKKVTVDHKNKKVVLER